MKYGTDCEPYAISTLVNNVIPLCEEFKGLVYKEEGGASFKSRTINLLPEND